MKKDNIKIQINSLEALERLIGEDPKLEFEIKGAVVQQFAKTHFKGVVNEMHDKDLFRQGLKELKEGFITRKSVWLGHKLADSFKELVIREVRSLFREQIRAEVRSYISGESDLKDRADFKTVVLDCVNYEVVKEINKIKQEHIRNAAKHLIKEKLKD